MFSSEIAFAGFAQAYRTAGEDSTSYFVVQRLL